LIAANSRLQFVRTSAWTKLNLKLAASAREIADLCFHMSSMISAGLSLHETMGILAGRTRNATLSRTLLRITEDIEEGNSLAGAFRRYRYAFGDLLISVLKAGENSGKLDVILQEYSEQLEEQSKLTSDLRTALVYPCVLVLMTVASVTFLTGWILPRYVEQLEAMNVEIPKITRILLAVSSWVGDNWLLVGAGVAWGRRSCRRRTPGEAVPLRCRAQAAGGRSLGPPPRDGAIRQHLQPPSFERGSSARDPGSRGSVGNLRYSPKSACATGGERFSMRGHGSSSPIPQDLAS
jgi:hypothetical protein